MANNTFKNFGQSGNVNQGRINSFIASNGVEELNDAASAAVNGGNTANFIVSFKAGTQEVLDAVADTRFNTRDELLLTLHDDLSI